MTASKRKSITVKKEEEPDVKNEGSFVHIKEEVDIKDTADHTLTKLRKYSIEQLEIITSNEKTPYPELKRPTIYDAVLVCDLLCKLHGEPNRDKLEEDCSGTGTLLEKRSRSVLDSLVRTILSQNTTDTLSKRAFESLKKSFPTYKALLKAPSAKVEESIKMGGLAQIKVGRIKLILETILKERPKECHNGEPSLEYLRKMSTEDIKAELGRFKGVGPKTVACVLMFTLGRDEFPVDTHVHYICQKRLGWIPPSASREDAYAHLNNRIPDIIKYDLHVLLVLHGKKCPSCSKGGRTLLPVDGPCPLNMKKLGKDELEFPLLLSNNKVVTKQEEEEEEEHEELLHQHQQQRKKKRA